MPQSPSSVVSLTDSARAEVLRLLGEAERYDTGLRLSVAGGGCSGLSYGLEFTGQEPGDMVTEIETGLRVFVDPKSVLYLKGVTVDFERGLSGRGFVFRNPNAENTCGCGESFSV